MVQSAEKNKQEQDALFALLQGKELTPEQKIIIDAMGGVNIGQKKTSATGAKSSTRKKELSWRSYIRSYSGPPIVYSGQPFVYNGKTRIVPRGALYLPKNDDEPAMLVLARNGEAIDINSIPMANSDQTPNKAKKSLSSATQMLDRAQKTGYQEQNKSFEIKKGLGQIVGNEGLYGGVKRAAGGAFGGVKAVGAGLLGTLATGSLLPLLAGGLYGAKKVIGGALGGLGIAAGGIMKGIGNVTGITPAIGKAWGGLKSKVGMGGPTKAERAGPLTNGQFINFEAKLFGYIDKEIDRDKRRLERMKRQSEYDEEAADESRGGERPGTPVRDGGPEKKPMSGLMKGLLVLGGIVALAAAITAIVVYKDELLKIWDEFGTALKVGAAIITGLAIKNFLDNLGGGGDGGMVPRLDKNGKPMLDKNGKPRMQRNFTVDPKGVFRNLKGVKLEGAALTSSQAAHARDLADISKGTKFAKAAGAVAKFLKPLAIVKKIPAIGTVLGAVMSAATLYDAYQEYEEEIEQAEGDKNEEKAAEEKLGTVVFREVGMLLGIAVGAAIGQGVIPIPGVGAILGSIVGADVGVEVGQAAAQSYFKGDDFLEILGGLLKEKYKANIEDLEKVAKWKADKAQAALDARRERGKALRPPTEPVDYKADLEDLEKHAAAVAAQGTATRTRTDSESKAAYIAYEADKTITGTKLTANDFSMKFKAGTIDEKGAPVAAPPPPEVSAPPPEVSAPPPSPGDSVATTKQGQPEVGAPPKPDSATIPPRVSEAAEKAIITLPVKVLEGQPMVMPSREPGQGSAPGEIQTRPNDRTLNSASSNLNASRQMAYT